MDNPNCPHCGYEFDDEETWYVKHSDCDVNTGDGEISELICHNDDCKKRFYNLCHHRIQFHACDEDGSDL